MKIKRRWICPHCGKMYYIRPNSQDELAVIESIQIMGFVLRTCDRCAYVMKITPREGTDDGRKQG